MLDLTIYTYGYSEILFHTLQAIAMFRNSNFYPLMVTTIALLVGVTYALRITMAASGDEMRLYLRKIIGMVIFIHILLLPTTSMSIKDNVEKHFWRVDNIPVAFALPIGLIENYGHLLTIGFEQVFSLVDSASAHSYYHHGSVFGARLQKEVLQAKVRDPEFISNMANFIDRCVILPSMIGKQFTKEELVASSDMWGLIAARAGTFARTPMTINGVRLQQHPTCKEAVPYFEKKFNDAASSSLTALSWKFKGVGKNSQYNPGSRALNNNIKTQIAAIYGNNTSVDTILKHNMMINAINNYRSGKYPSAKALMHNEAGGLISGDLAEKTLTGSLAVMKVIVYGSYIFLFPLLILSGGLSKYKGWLTAAFSLSLWPSLFSMLNMIIDFAYQPATIISYSSWATEKQKFDSIASTAASLTLAIPVLSFWLTRMCEGGLMHLAGSIMASANSASSAMAGEKASGTRSWDNEAMRNSSSDNLSSNKHDSSMQYVSSSARSQGADGTTEYVSPSGQVLYFGGSGQSSSTGESTIRESDGINANYERGIREEEQAMTRQQANYSRSQERLISNEVSALESIAKNTKTDTGYNIDTSTKSGKEISKTLNAVDKLNKTNDYGWNQNAQAYVSSELGTGSIAKLLGASAQIGGKVEASNSSSQNNSEDYSIASESGSHDRQSNSERINKSENFLTSLGVDKNTQDSIRESYSDATRLEKSISAHRDKIDSYNESINYTKTHSSEYSKDMFQDTIDAYQEKYGGSAKEAHKAVSDGAPEARMIVRELTASKAQNIMQEIGARAGKIHNSENVNSLTKANSIDNNIGAGRDEFAREHEIETNANKVTTDINSGEQLLKNQYQAKTNDNSSEYNIVKSKNAKTQDLVSREIAKNEEDRIGNGVATTIFGVTEGLGRSPEQANDDLDFKPLMLPYEPSSSKAPQDRYGDNKEQVKDIIDSKGRSQFVDPKN